MEVTSENPAQPIEMALARGQEGQGWRAGQPGEQTIRLIFDQPQQLKRVRLSFVETEVERAQEFVLRWSADDGRSFQEIVRQQWNFDPRGSTREVEDYSVNLAGLTMLELTIIPDRSKGQVFASLDQLRLA